MSYICDLLKKICLIFGTSREKTTLYDAPDIDTDRPISRQRELKYVHHYNWPVYWGMSPARAGAYSAATSNALALEQAQTSADRGAPKRFSLRRTREVLGYYTRARDEDIGYVDDFSWTMPPGRCHLDDSIPGR